ncbi:hypothetical protein ACJJTC_003344 [Scirpophaga incertulas]
MECDSVHAAIERKLKNREIHIPSDFISVTLEAGRKTGDPVVVDIRAIKYSREGIIFYKLKFDDDWTELPIRPKKIPLVTYSNLHAEPIPIASTKFHHLQQLKAVLPRDCHSFYDNLPYV